MRILAVIPAYNEQRTIAEVVLKAEKYVDEVVVVDDGSSDLTGEIARRMGATVLRHETNRGKGAALRTGFLHALRSGADVVVTLDADGQHDPDEIPRLIEPIIKGGADVVVGSRYLGTSQGIPLYRRVGLALINALGRLVSGAPVSDTQSGFRAYSRRALSVVVRAQEEGYAAELEHLTLASGSGLKIVEVPVSIRYSGLVRTSKANPLIHAAELVNSLIYALIYRRPLLYLGLPGTLLLVCGVALGFEVVRIYFRMRVLALGYALISVTMVILGWLLISTSLTIFIIKETIRGARR